MVVLRIFPCFVLVASLADLFGCACRDLPANTGAAVSLGAVLEQVEQNRARAKALEAQVLELTKRAERLEAEARSLALANASACVCGALPTAESR